MEFRYLHRKILAGVATLTIDRPQSLNALNSELVGELERAFAELDRDDRVKVVILTGAGEKVFVAGGDVREMATMNPVEAHRFMRNGQQLMLQIESMKKLVIAAVNGYALGGGLELALACDFIYASDTARFGLPEVTLGAIPGFGGTQNLARLIGPHKAKELIATGKTITAQKACAWGIVNEVFPPEELMKEARETAELIACNGPAAVGAAKDAVNNGLDMAKEDGLRYEASLVGVLFSTSDQKEGMQAFLEKRKAEFAGT